MEELSIRVNIADRYYPLTIAKDEEEMVRSAAKLINDKLRELQQQFAVKDKQDMLSMVSLELATGLLRNTEKDRKEMDEVTEGLNRILRLVTDNSN